MTMTTFSGGNLQNEALAKIGVFQHPETMEYYYGGKRNDDGKVSGNITIIPKEEAETLAKRYIELNEKAKKTEAGSITNLLLEIRLHHDQDGNYVGKNDNLIPPQHLLKLIDSVLGINKLSFGTNYQDIRNVRRGLPSLSPTQEENIADRTGLINKITQQLENITSGYLFLRAQEQSFGDMNDPHNIDKKPNTSPLYTLANGVELLFITPPSAGPNMGGMGGGLGIGKKFR